eukprot:SAG11_NODE_1112_length_5821_cov_43.477281_3_plen_79_part_00
MNSIITAGDHLVDAYMKFICAALTVLYRLLQIMNHSVHLGLELYNVCTQTNACNIFQIKNAQLRIAPGVAIPARQCAL